MQRPRSTDVTGGPATSGVRATLRGIGRTKADASRARIGVVNSWNEATPRKAPASGQLRPGGRRASSLGHPRPRITEVVLGTFATLVSGAQLGAIIA